MLASIEHELRKEGIGWGNVMYIHLYIDDMSAFAQINQVYMDIITESRCARGVPSRSTVGLALLDGGVGRVMVEVIGAKNLDKRVLHVQSISCWAPSCIGPYSQVHANV
jgi:diphthine-ammonia ligase